ncbi:MAG TPA: hypothetical protein VLR88_11605, partial [Propionibacteriaceae bacterium]|nr:hypothetical protein [Propionibacteriaceae bacterium]
RATARAYMTYTRVFWGLWAITMILTILGVGLWTGHAWVGWVGGVAGLLQGAGIGHLIDREAARRASTPVPAGLN